MSQISSSTQRQLDSYQRRSFIKMTGATAGGLIVGFNVSGCAAEPPIPVQQSDGLASFNAFLQISSLNEVIFYCPRDEMGQGITTGLTTLIAEELDISPQKISIRFAGAHKVYDNPLINMQITGGSTSINAHYLPLRQVAANARALLLKAAAQQLDLALETLSTQDGTVMHKGKSYAYGDFAESAVALSLSEDAPLKPKHKFNYIGKEFARLDAIVKSTGTAVYGIDIDIPYLHYALVKRCPVAGGRLRKFDQNKASKMPGVTDIVEVASGVAVVAKQFWQAKKALEELSVEWDLPELAKLNSQQIKQEYEKTLTEKSGSKEGVKGDVNKVFTEAESTHEQRYWTPYLAHTPLEPMNAVVKIDKDKAEVWTGTQAPGSTQGLVARFAGLSKQQVTVHNIFLGGGFGRRGVLTHVVEATQVAKQTGKPIKLLWTREDDIQHGLYRPASLMSIKASVDKQGKINAWQAKRVGGNIMPDTLKYQLPGLLPPQVPKVITGWMAGISKMLYANFKVDDVSVEGLAEDYDFANKEVEQITLNHGLPLTYWRSVGHSFTAFAKESFIDELAHQSKVEPVTFRLNNSKQNPRLNKAIDLVGLQLKQQALPVGRAWGVAAHSSFASYVAQAAQVSVQNNKIKVHKVICAVDCGHVINPDIVRTQMEGAIVFGLTAALFGQIDIENGEVKQSNFHDYPLLTMQQTPEIEVFIIDSEAKPTGVGEPGLPPIAPAVANAVFAATGQRLRSLPLQLT